jgi:hypothetical protein
MLIEKDGVLNCVFLRYLIYLSLFSFIIILVLLNVLKVGFSPGYGQVSGLWWTTHNRPTKGEVVCAQCGLVVAD